MQMTLKKASEVARRALADGDSVQYTYRFSFIDGMNESLAGYRESEAKLLAHVESRTAIIAAAYELRDIISAANHRSGVNSVLAKIAEKTAVLELINLAVAHGAAYERPSYNALQARTAQYAHNPKDHANSAMLGCLSKDAEVLYRENIAALTKELSKLRDELTALNFTTKVAITDEMAQTLDSFI